MSALYCSKLFRLYSGLPASLKRIAINSTRRSTPIRTDCAIAVSAMATNSHSPMPTPRGHMGLQESRCPGNVLPAATNVWLSCGAHNQADPGLGEPGSNPGGATSKAELTARDPLNGRRLAATGRLTSRIHCATSHPSVSSMIHLL